MENSMSTLSAGLLLFLIMDPLGNIPLFLSLLRDVDPKRRQLILVRELLIALVVLFVFLFGGTYLLHVLQLKQESVSIAAPSLSASRSVRIEAVRASQAARRRSYCACSWLEASARSSRGRIAAKNACRR